MTNFEILKQRLKSLSKTAFNEPEYYVPGKWVESTESAVKFHPIDYFLNRITEIEHIQLQTKPTTKSLDDCIIYSMMPRYTTAFKHFKTENLTKIELNFNETGSILKTLALLPYLKSTGTDILFLLPISTIGEQNHKGNAGSVYAVRNPKILDGRLNEKFLGLNLAVQLSALVEAAHAIGMIVVTEFIFRTASIDSDLIRKNPEFFYWIKEECAQSFCPPKFSEEQIKSIKEKIADKDFSDLTEPDEEYKAQFTETPQRVEFEHGKYIGYLKNGNRCVVPGAFADWPPDDNQPVWSDVTYLKYYDNPKFNYIAYNTVRMYDSRLTADSEINPKLEKYIRSVIPYYIKMFNIDGAMLDMGHALPGDLTQRIVIDCKIAKRGFLFFGENFQLNDSVSMKLYDAVTGYLPFDLHKHNDANAFLWRIAREEISESSFATAETHNTKRTQAWIPESKFSTAIWTAASFLPKTVRYINSGFELLEQEPINTGLGFTDEEIKSIDTDKLPLFSDSFMNWTPSALEDIRLINKLRSELIDGRIDDYTLRVIEPFHPEILSFMLSNEEGRSIFIAVNYSNNKQLHTVTLPDGFNAFYNSLKNVNLEVCNNCLKLEMDGFESLIGILSK